MRARRLALVARLGLALGCWGLAGCSDADDTSAGASSDWADVVSRAEALHEAEDHEQSAVAYARAAELALAAGDASAHHAYRAQRGVCLKMLGRTEEARGELLAALAWARANGVARIEGLALGNMARVAAIEGALDEQQDWYAQVVAFADRIGDLRLVVHTLEQSSALAMRRGDVAAARGLVERAIALDPELDPVDRRGDALRRQKAWTLVAAGDDEGAAALWAFSEPSGAGLANQAHQLSDLGRHAEAARLALEAARRFEEQGELRRTHRDRALRLHLSQLLAAGELDACAARLEGLLVSSDDPAVLAPWRVIEARLAVARGRSSAAVDPLATARAGLEGPAATEAGWLLAAALWLSARPGQALDLLDELPASQACDLLRAAIFSTHPPEQGLATEALTRLDPGADLSDDESVRRLRALLPEPLPSLAFATLDLALADADRMRAEGQDRVARLFMREGLVSALRWQAREAGARVLGRWPEADGRVAEQATSWVAGELEPDEAVIIVLPGRRLSYLVLCTAELGGTSFGIAAESVLAQRVAAVARALKQPSTVGVVAASHALFAEIFGERALVDLEGKTRWTLVLPDVLTPVPPPMWVTAAPADDQPTTWLVREVTTRLLPHAGSSVEPGGPAGWVQIGEPALELDRSLLAAPALTARYGQGALEPGPLRVRMTDDAVRHVGARATAGRVREALVAATTLELSVPALGGGRLGGLLLAPDPEATAGDEAVGFLPWQRLAELEGRSVLILDRARFLPGASEHGAAYAATAALRGGLPVLLATRWPLPRGIREGMLRQLEAAPADTSWATRLATVQRLYLAGAEAAGDPGWVHPRRWAAWLLFDAGG